MNPVMSFASAERKKERCPQSWKTMKIRTTNVPANAARIPCSHHGPSWNRYSRTHRPMYGRNVFAICHAARAVDGVSYFRTSSFHSEVEGGSCVPDSIG